MASYRYGIPTLSWVGYVLGLVLCTQSQAATLFGVVSDRSAAALAAGAEQFDRQYPGHRLILRTPSQLQEATDADIAALWHEADVVMLVAVFGDMAVRLKRLLKESSPPAGTDVIAFNNDRRLTRLSRVDGHLLFKDVDDTDLDALASNPSAETDFLEWLSDLERRYPAQQVWIQARAFWQGRGSGNVANLIAWALRQHIDAALPAPRPLGAIRYFHQGRIVPKEQLALTGSKPLVAVLDYDTGDQVGRRALLERLCQTLEQRQLQCLGVLARWGEASAQALVSLQATAAPAKVDALVSLQDFVVGGETGREAVTESLASLNIPVFKGVRLTDRTENQWRLSEEGLPWNSVHYRVAMPEVQGIGQPMVLAAATPPHIDPLTGVRIATIRPLPDQIDTAVERITRWVVLRHKPNKEKTIAIIYYNHPPGRHNIGADNLDVPASLWEILQTLKQAGYQTGPLPTTPEALLQMLQERGVNMPENHAALRAMSARVERVSLPEYQRWFRELPEVVQREVIEGPLGYLHGKLRAAVDTGALDQGQRILSRIVGDLRHLLEGVDHPQRDRALDLLAKLSATYDQIFAGKSLWGQAQELIEALGKTGIEGLRGWGPPPGKVMVQDNRILIPGLRFGNIFIGPQPPRGWEVNEELLHANTTIPPTHQYLAFYFWLRHSLRADAAVHLGRHSTYEFLPHRRVGLAADDYPAIIAGDIPGVYPYIVDGVGEGIQAKRRGLAVIVDHLTPPLRTTPLYDELLQLRQLVESYEAAAGQEDNSLRERAVQAIRQNVVRLNLRDELEASMRGELAVRGIGFDQIDDGLLVHEVGHYLTQLQEQFMPHGLHIFGRRWKPDAVDMMLESMEGDRETRRALEASPQAEMEGLLAGLQGRFVRPGKGNDPIRTPEALPTGRNFHALDGGVLPTRLGYELGARLATKARAKNPTAAGGNDAVVLWASDTVRDEGAMVAFGLDMLGIRPVWNSRGIVKGLALLPLEDGRVRRDTVFTTSGLFRDLYGNLLAWVDRGVCLALKGAALTIRERYPELDQALDAALEPVAELGNYGAESLAINRVAANWVATTQKALEHGADPAVAGRQAIRRIFGDAPGAYGAGVNRLTERSGAWMDRREVGEAYLLRMGHAYGADAQGEAAHAAFKTTLTRVENVYLGRASNLYGLMDNNDAFDYLGGLSLAVETLTGRAPASHVIQHADPNDPKIEPLEKALLQELRGRFLNPAWLEPLMGHGYAGARTMGSEFMEYLWGWQVTNPDIVKSWVWDEVKSVYLDDSLGLGLDEFLDRDHNVHVKIHMQAILLVAAYKGYWDTDQATLEQLANDFAERVSRHGLPGSGHTRPDHPMMEWLKPQLQPQRRQALHAALQQARGAQPNPGAEGAATPTAVELEVQDKDSERTSPHQPMATGVAWAVLSVLLILLIGGAARGLRSQGAWHV